MTAFRLAAGELRRITAGRLPKLAVLALVLVPLLYGSLYVYANWDPYGRLNKVPAALVVADTGAKTPDGKEVHAGAEVADELGRSGAFNWHRVSAADAEQGVHDGKYTFALTIPADFSQALVSPAQFQPRQGILVLTTNDANNYLVSTIADKVVDEVRRAVATRVGTEAADRFLLGFSTISDKLRQAVDGANKLADGSKQAADGAAQLDVGQHRLADGSRQLADGSATAASGAAALADGLGQLRQKTADMPAQTRQLADGANRVADGAARVADGNAQVATKAGVAADASQQVVNNLDTIRSNIASQLTGLGLSEAQVQQALAALDTGVAPVRQANARIQTDVGQLRQLSDGSRQVADGARQVANGANQLASATPALTGAIGQASDGSNQLRDGTAKLASGAATLRDGEQQAVSGTDKLAGGTAQLRDGNRTMADQLGAATGAVPDPNDPTRQATARTIGDPVAIQNTGMATAGTYGAGLAPFFLGLALWVGAFVLFLLLRPLSPRALAARQPALRIAVGGWLPAALLGVAQATLLFAVVTTLIGVHPAHPLAAYGFLLLTTLAFTAMIHGLNAYFGAVGKFLALVLLVLQLTTAGGTFPWQTTPDPLHPLHLALPLSYVVDAMRHLLYGGGLATMGEDVTVLASYLLAGLVLSTVAAYKQRVWTPTKLKPELVL
ncbi:YhgE/Pip domain-containing protein [Gandjariella thermophila]|uniref:ABC transporter n=1 Tax=Gandjariella thermophila TaxID=1931992 RepID=A0A4D4J7T9_9PSEU|nr:YhgE/Pip domain-containing protein [Gandjariella thermophila]GDY31090.1 ABC transporter [Gandjariella thermophila]